jgi:hypothetical protein
VIKGTELQVGKTYRVVKLPNGNRAENGGVWTIKYKNENSVPFGVRPEWPVDHSGTRLSTSHMWEEVVTGPNFDDVIPGELKYFDKSQIPTPQELAKSSLSMALASARMVPNQITIKNTIATRDLEVGMVYQALGDATNEVEVTAKTSSLTIGRRDGQDGDFILDPDHEWLFAYDPRVKPAPQLEPTRMSRDDILREAAQAVTVDRAATHGDMEDNFSNIAQIWSVRLGKTVTAEQVAIMMVDIKTVRAWGNPGHMDNWVDMAGYAACGGEISDGIED